MTPRRLLLTSIGLTLAAFVLDPARPRVALGVVGGCVLAGLSFWAIRGGVHALLEPRPDGSPGRGAPGAALVKFFTRHAILAAAAYGMMARLHLDPVGMLIGVSAPVVALGAGWVWPRGVTRGT